MRKVYILDFETTGIDPYLDRPIQVAIGEYDTENKVLKGQPTSFYIHDDTYPELSDEVSQLTGIHQEDLNRFGIPPKEVMQQLIALTVAEPTDPRTPCIVAHNANNFDRIVFETEFKRHGLALPDRIWIDSRTDIKYSERQRCKVLSHLVLDHGFVVDPATLHRADADVELLAQLLSKYDFRDIFKRAVGKKVVIAARVQYEDRQLAKDAGFRWQQLSESDKRNFPKRWVKEILEEEFEVERVKYSFQVELL